LVRVWTPISFAVPGVCFLSAMLVFWDPGRPDLNAAGEGAPARSFTPH
jgi:hypothetical protein